MVCGLNFKVHLVIQDGLFLEALDSTDKAGNSWLGRHPLQVHATGCFMVAAILLAHLVYIRIGLLPPEGDQHELDRTHTGLLAIARKS